MILRTWLLSACLIFGLVMNVASLCAQNITPENHKLYVGDLFTRKITVDPSHRNTLELIRPKLEPPGSAIIHFQVDPADSSQILLQAVPLTPTRLKIDRFGYRYRSTDQKYFPPIELEAKAWPIKAANRAIRAGVGSLKLSLQMPPSKTAAGIPQSISLQAIGTAALAIESKPEIEILSTEAPTDAIRLQPVNSRIDWPNTTRQWTYEWIPQSPGTFRMKPLFFAFLGPDHQLKTIATTTPPLEVMNRPVFTQPDAVPSPIASGSRKTRIRADYLLLTLSMITLCVIFAVSPFIRRLILRYRLRRALRSDQSFDTTLAIYRKINRNRHLALIISNPAERNQFDLLEKRLFDRS